MKKNRRIITLILVAGMLLSFASCTGKQSSGDESTSDAPETTDGTGVSGETTAADGALEVAKQEYTFTKLGETVIVPNSVISKTSLVQLPPAEQFKVPFCATGDASKLDEIAAEIAERAKAAAESVSPVTQDPKVFFSEITEYGFRGSIVMRVEDSTATGSAADAVVRAIAPLTR